MNFLERYKQAISKSGVSTMRLTALLVTLVLAASAQQSNQSAPVYANAVIATMHALAHQVSQTTLINSDICSATAVGPNALLTAAHCEEATDTATVDGHTVRIIARVRDERDHSIYLLDGISFKQWATLTIPRQVAVGEELQFFGNPGELTDLYRKVTVTKNTPSERVIRLDGVVNHGDSGAGLYDKDGQLLSVVSFARREKQESEDSVATVRSAGAYPLEFSQEQLNLVTKPVAQTPKKASAEVPGTPTLPAVTKVAQ